jgi:hypothetical protein
MASTCLHTAIEEERTGMIAQLSVDNIINFFFRRMSIFTAEQFSVTFPNPQQSKILSTFSLVALSACVHPVLARLIWIRHQNKPDYFIAFK